MKLCNIILFFLIFVYSSTFSDDDLYEGILKKVVSDPDSTLFHDLAKWRLSLKGKELNEAEKKKVIDLAKVYITNEKRCMDNDAYELLEQLGEKEPDIILDLFKMIKQSEPFNRALAQSFYYRFIHNYALDDDAEFLLQNADIYDNNPRSRAMFALKGEQRFNKLRNYMADEVLRPGVNENLYSMTKGTLPFAKCLGEEAFKRLDKEEQNQEREKLAQWLRSTSDIVYAQKEFIEELIRGVQSISEKNDEYEKFCEKATKYYDLSFKHRKVFPLAIAESADADINEYRDAVVAVLRERMNVVKGNADWNKISRWYLFRKKLKDIFDQMEEKAFAKYYNDANAKNSSEKKGVQWSVRDYVRNRSQLDQLKKLYENDPKNPPDVRISKDKRERIEETLHEGTLKELYQKLWEEEKELFEKIKAQKEQK